MYSAEIAVERVNAIARTNLRAASTTGIFDTLRTAESTPVVIKLLELVTGGMSATCTAGSVDIMVRKTPPDGEQRSYLIVVSSWDKWQNGVGRLLTCANAVAATNLKAVLIFYGECPPYFLVDPYAGDKCSKIEEVFSILHRLKINVICDPASVLVRMERGSYEPHALDYIRYREKWDRMLCSAERTAVVPTQADDFFEKCIARDPTRQVEVARAYYHAALYAIACDTLPMSRARFEALMAEKGVERKTCTSADYYDGIALTVPPHVDPPHVDPPRADPDPIANA